MVITRGAAPPAVPGLPRESIWWASAPSMGMASILRFHDTRFAHHSQPPFMIVFLVRYGFFPPPLAH